MSREFHKKKALYHKWAETAYEGEIPDFPICRRSPLERLIVLLAKLPELEEKFKAKGIPTEIFTATVGDIRLRQKLYFQKTGKLGLSRSDVIWFRHLFGFLIFQLGSLQFQTMPMIYLDAEGCGEDYMQYVPEEKKKLPTGSPVLNIHIPVGADLSPEAVRYSFSCATEFFDHYFPDYHAKAFRCVSWLLYPPLQRLLAPRSNIAEFAAQWRIIASAENQKEGICRIYGKRYGRLTDYPQNTSLQKAVLHHFSCLGEADGIMEIA